MIGKEVKKDMDVCTGRGGGARVVAGDVWRDGKRCWGELASLGAPPPQFMKAITERRQ